MDIKTSSPYDFRNSCRDASHASPNIKLSGITMASGSGSCGAALACMITERVNRKVNVHLVYGELAIEWADDDFVYQEGPATEVYTGVWPG